MKRYSFQHVNSYCFLHLHAFLWIKWAKRRNLFSLARGKRIKRMWLVDGVGAFTSIFVWHTELSIGCLGWTFGYILDHLCGLRNNLVKYHKKWRISINDRLTEGNVKTHSPWPYLNLLNLMNPVIQKERKAYHLLKNIVPRKNLVATYNNSNNGTD